MKSQIKKHFLLIPAFSFAANLFFAQPTSDAGMWNTFSIEKQFNAKFFASIDQELRLKENFTMLNLLYTNLGIGMKPFKGLKVSLTYRWIDKWRYETQNFSIRQRLMLDITYKQKVGVLSLAYRARFQTEYRDFSVSQLGKVPEWFWRNKFDVKYKIGKYTPYIGVEFRYQIKDPRNPDADNGWHRVRSFAGVDYDINANNSCGVYYLTQHDLGVRNAQYLYILGLQYSITLKPKDKTTVSPTQ